MSIKAERVSLLRGKRQVLSDIQLEIQSGEILGVIGPNGSGKTTLLNLLAGDFPASTGEIYYENLLINDYTLIDRAKYRSVMSQRQEIVFSYTVKEIIEMGIVGEYGIDIDTHTTDRLQNILELLQLQELKDRNVRTLSGGEQQRVHIARALVQIWQERYYPDPRFLLLDEPTSSLDPKIAVEMMELIKKISDELRIPVLCNIHNIELAKQFANKILGLQDGKKKFDGVTEKLTHDVLQDLYKFEVL